MKGLTLVSLVFISSLLSNAKADSVTEKVCIKGEEKIENAFEKMDRMSQSNQSQYLYSYIPHIRLNKDVTIKSSEKGSSSFNEYLKVSDTCSINVYFSHLGDKKGTLELGKGLKIGIDGPGVTVARFVKLSKKQSGMTLIDKKKEIKFTMVADNTCTLAEIEHESKLPSGIRADINFSAPQRAAECVDANKAEKTRDIIEQAVSKAQSRGV